MTGETELDLVGLCAGLAEELDEVTGTDARGEVTYARGGTAFARVTATSLEVRLPADIAEAAVRTPDTTAGEGVDWVRFTPATAERHVTDRAGAWFQTAWRHAGER